MPHKVWVLSVVEPRLPSHDDFFDAMAASPNHITADKKWPAVDGYYGSDLITHALDITQPDVSAVVAADTKSAIALIDARATATPPHPPIIISGPNNQALTDKIAAAADPSSIYVMGAGVPEPRALAWLTYDLARKARLFDVGDNVIVLIYNADNPGSIREVDDTVAWFDGKFPPGAARRVTVMPFPVHAAVPSAAATNATGLYNISTVLGQITVLRRIANVKAVVTTGDPTLRYYRSAITSYYATWAPPLPVAWADWRYLTQDGVICWSGERAAAWAQVTAKTLEFCGGPDPELGSIANILAGNTKAADDLGISWQDIDSLCGVPIHWFTDVPEDPPNDRYTHQDLEEPPTQL